MHWVYTLRCGTELGPLVVRLTEGGQGPLVHATECWGGRTVHRFILQFRFEIRVGVRDAQVDFLHRSCAAVSQREADRAWFEAQLHELYAARVEPS